MPSLAIVYFSASGATAALADAVRDGAAPQVRVSCHRIAGHEIVDGRYVHEPALALVDEADAVIFGSPTYMGGPAAQFKAFADASGERWATARWKDKLAAGFTTGTCPNGDQGYTLAWFSVLAAQHGMLWCNLDLPGGIDPLGRNRLGTQLGLATQSADGVVAPEDLLTAHHLGQRVALLAQRLQGRPDPAA